MQIVKLVINHCVKLFLPLIFLLLTLLPHQVGQSECIIQCCSNNLIILIICGT